MAIVKTNNAELEAIASDLAKAYECIEAAEEVWGENFDNLLNNIVTSGYLDSLYEDAKSNWRYWKGTITVVASIVVFAACLATPVGWVALAIAALGSLFGIGVGVKTIVSEPDWHTESKVVFENLLNNCAYGNDDCYIQICNIATALYNTRLSLEKIKSKINEFQKLYADLNATAESMGVKTTLASDGTTVLSVDTEVTIDGQTIEISTSDALNAFYTYENTVMSAMIEADILERTYGYDIDYNAIVKNANAFMTDTINSGLYSHEFIDALLPNYTPDENAAYDATSAATGIDNDKLKNLMSEVSNLNIFPGLGLLSAAFIGSVGTSDDNSNNLNPGPSQNPSPSGGTPSGTTGGTPSGVVIPSTGTTGGTPSTSQEDEDKTDEEEKDKEKQNDIEITEISEEELPESVTNEEEVDYDALAKEKFEFETDYDELLEHRSEIIQDIEAKFDSGDLDSIRDELKEYGYNNAEIESILQDRFMTIKAIVQGDQDAQLSKMANELAKADGVEDFSSKYDERPDYTLLEDDGPSDALMLASEDENVVKLYDEMSEAKVAYNDTIDKTNEMLQAVTENKQSMEDLKTKYEKEFGEDTTQWSEDAAKEYNEAIETYNKSVEDATEQMKVLEESKASYEAARKEFTDAREAYYEKQRNNQGSSESSGINEDTSSDGSTNNIGINDDKPDPGNSDMTPTNDGIVYLDGSDANNSGTSTIDDSVVLTDTSIEIK